jgi:hypothetical protein
MANITKPALPSGFVVIHRWGKEKASISSAQIIKFEKTYYEFC